MIPPSGSPLRVLALVTAAFGGRGGIAQYNRDYIQALSGIEAIESIDILPREQSDPSGALPAKVRQHAPVLGRLAFSAAALAFAIRYRPHVVFCGHLYMAPLAALARRVTGGGLIVQLHGIEIWDRLSSMRRKSLESADLVQCVSRDTRARALMAAALPPERVIIVPNTVMDDFQPGDGTSLRQRLGLGAQKILLSVGRLDSREQYKGHEDVLAILAGLIRDGYDVRYIIAGEGDDRPRLERIAQAAGLAHHVIFLGHATREDLPRIYRAADLFILPSLREGFGIVFLEALASGVPAIGLAEGGAADALEELGLAVRRHDLEAAVRTILDHADHDPQALAHRVRSRFGRPVFDETAATAFMRLAGPGSHAGAGAP